MDDSGCTDLAHDVEATQIPNGNRVRLPAGTSVSVTQALGGSYTVIAAGLPGLFRIEGTDSLALGREADDARPSVGGPFDEELVWEQLRNCYDPEIPINIVDLGLIYGLEVSEASSGGKDVDVKMTLTAPGCGMGPSLAADAQRRILEVAGVESASVELVWDPPWSPDRISSAGREKLGMV